MVVRVTCNNEEDPIKNEGASVLMTFLPLWIFSDAQWQLTPLKFELVRDFKLVLFTYKNEEGPIKKGARVLTRLYIDFFRRSRAANSTVRGGIPAKLIQWLSTLPARIKDPIKNEGSRVPTTFLPL